MGAAAAGAFGTLGFHGWAGTAGGVVARAISLGWRAQPAASPWRSANGLEQKGRSPVGFQPKLAASGAAWAAAASRSSSERASSAFKRVSSAMRRASARRARTSSSLGPRAG